MTWKPTVDMDTEIRRWMKAKGWEVNHRPEHDEGDVYTWRHEFSPRSSYTLRITRQVLDGFPAFAVLYHLDVLKVAAAIRARPDVRYVLVLKDGCVTLETTSQS
jgi:hypothetical protein